MDSDLGSERFTPLRHGFTFQNEFSGIPFLYQRFPKAHRLIHHLFLSRTLYGLCGGMCFTALDYFHAKQSLPLMSAPPTLGHTLHTHLFQRQRETYGRFGQALTRFLLWSLHSDALLESKTYRELMRIQPSLDRHQPVVLGLVYVHISQTIAIWMNHQVIAYRYDRTAKGETVYLYDPNYPSQDDIVIDLIKTKRGVQCIQRNLRHNGAVPVRGFFEVPYRRRLPLSPPEQSFPDASQSPS
jgi:hypothetical protein